MEDSIAKQGRTKSQRKRPFFDFYGIQPKFYMNGRDKTTTWIGCLCTVVLILSLAAVSVYYF